VNADSIAVIRTRLPYVDRRALSEAWFSALHLARGDGAAPKREPRATVTAPPARMPARRLGSASAASSPQRSLSFGPRRAPAPALAASPTPSRRTGGAVVAAFPSRRIRYAPVRASFHIGRGQGRVQIVLRRDGAVLHVVAICGRRHLELVRRALACADLHLRLQGETVRSSVRAFEEHDR
jgi:hypothetical protein